MKKTLKKLYKYFTPQDEKENMVKFLKKMNLLKGSRVLDVGCGYGRNMNLIKENCDREIWVEGVDINEHIVKINRKKGLFCYTIEEFHRTTEKYDCLIFSHIIEHFTPEGLKDFLETYLRRLKDGGHVIIMTPVLWSSFYKDFDHIKMYHPIGIQMVFGNGESQVQYYSEDSLVLRDIWFRKMPYEVDFKRGIYVDDRWSLWWLFVNTFYRIMFRCSFGAIGESSGWMGLYEKNWLKSKLKVLGINKYEKSCSVAIWGTGIVAKELIKCIEEVGLVEGALRGFFNGNDLKLVGTKFCGYEVLDYRKLNDYKLSAIIIASTDYGEEIYQQIKRLSDKQIDIIRIS